MTTTNRRAICGLLTSAFVFATPSGLLYADKQQKTKPASKMQTPKEGYLLSVSTSKQNYTGDEPVMFNVISTNVSKQDSDIIVGSPIGLYDTKIIKLGFQKAVITQQGEKLIERGQSGMSMLTTLQPGGKRVDTINVSRLYEPFLPGKYRISVARKIKKRSSDNEYTTLESNSVFFTVTTVSSYPKLKTPHFNQIGPVTNGYRLTATTNKKVYYPGESIGFMLTIRNMTKTKVNVGFGANVSDFQVEIWGPDGEKVGYTTYGHKVFNAIEGGSHFIDTLNQGDERYVKAVINDYYDMSAPGRYKIVAFRSLPNREKPEQYVTVTSNPVVVFVKSGKAK